MDLQRKISFGFLGAVILFGCAIFGGISYYTFWNTQSPTQMAIQRKLKREHETLVHFNLSDPNDAPEKIRGLVELGYALMIDTNRHAPEYAGNGKMACTNCHFAGGNTTGGKNGAISLAGVAAKYPWISRADGKVINLASRINNCFEKSMNGKPLPLDSNQMLALETYLHWISKGVPIYEDVPWLGLELISIEHSPDPIKGQKKYRVYCAMCHGENGEGKIDTPPLWGPDAFNRGAGMNDPKMFSSFIYLNMPYTDPSLTIEEAWNITAFVLQQPRPEYDHKNK